MVEYVV